MTKPETLDCVEVKRRAQRDLAKALAGHSPDEQVEILHRLAAKTKLWKNFAKLRSKSSPATARKAANRRSTG